MGDFYSYSPATPADEPEAPKGAQAPAPYLHRGAMRVTVREGENTTENLRQITDSGRGGGRQSVPAVDFSRARSQEGMPRAHAIIDRDTIIHVGGMETTVEVAEYLGYVRHDPSKGWVSTADGSASAEGGNQDGPKAGDQEALKAEPNQALDAQSEAYLSEAFEKANGAAVTVASELIEAGDVSPSRVERLASDLGIEPSEAAARIEHVQAAYVAEATTAAASLLGGDAELAAAVLEWAGESIPEKAQEAALHHFTTGKPEYGTLVREWLAALPDHDPETALGANMPAGCAVYRDNASGAVLVRLPHGGTVEWEAAVRGGLITVAPVRKAKR